MENLTSSPLFGVTLTLLMFRLAINLKERWPHPLVNPLLVGIGSIILILVLLGIPYEAYSIGGAYIHFLLGPATVVLAIPLYKQMGLLKKNLIPILVGVLSGSIFAMAAIILIGKITGLPELLILSLIPKSVTMPIGIEVAQTLGGIPAITVIAIVVTGLTGAVFGGAILRIGKIQDPVAQGIAIGTSAHALGTTKAIEMGETQGGMSGLAIGLAGIITAILAPLILIML